MVRSDWWAVLALYETVLVWPLALLAVVFLAKAKTAGRRVLASALLVLVFLPHLQRHAGDLYFDYLCRTQAGEFIYRTISGVDGIAQLRTRDYSLDFFDAARHGNYPEDPVGHVILGWGGQKGSAFVRKVGDRYVSLYRFFETVVSPSNSNEGYVRYSAFDPVTGLPARKEYVDRLSAKFGYTYRGLNQFILRLLEISGGETLVINLESAEVLAVFRGFLRSGRKYAICPRHSSSNEPGRSLSGFVTRTLRPRLSTSDVTETP